MSNPIILTKDEFYISELCRKEYGYNVDIQPKQPITKKQAIQLMRQIITNSKKIAKIESYVRLLQDGDPENESPEKILNVIDKILGVKL